MGDVFRNVFRPALGRVEGHDTNGVAVLPGQIFHVQIVGSDRQVEIFPVVKRSVEDIGPAGVRDGFRAVGRMLICSRWRSVGGHCAQSAITDVRPLQE